MTYCHAMGKRTPIRIDGEAIRRARENLPMTRGELAERCDMDVSAIRHAERGRQSMSLAAALKLANVLDVPIAEFASLANDHGTPAGAA